MKFKMDFARGIVYSGKNGYLVQINQDGLYIDRLGEIVYLTDKNTKVIKDSYDYGK